MGGVCSRSASHRTRLSFGAQKRFAISSCRTKAGTCSFATYVTMRFHTKELHSCERNSEGHCLVQKAGCSFLASDSCCSTGRLGLILVCDECSRGVQWLNYGHWCMG